jgi:hypothetical protein
MWTLLTRRALTVATFCAALASSTLAQSDRPDSWLDQPVRVWTGVPAALPRAVLDPADRASLMNRCALTLLRSSPGSRALADAGWIPFLNYGRELVLDDVEVVGGMTDLDGMCRPWRYNLFVFVGGRFAGTLSPVLMDARADGSAGEARILDPATVIVDFARYRAADPLCCPSGQVTMRYRIIRSQPGPLVVPGGMFATGTATP